MAARSERKMSRAAPAVAIAIAAFAFLWVFPLFRIVPLRGTATHLANPATGRAFDPAAVAAKLWSGELPEAAQRAADASVVAASIRADPSAARRSHARSEGLGTAYYFVRGTGTVIARDHSMIRLALEGPQPAIVALRIGPIFGNAVRDGTGLLDVNQVPGLHEFNALAAELNLLVESQVLPGLREKTDVGAVVTFAGCAEAPESVPEGNAPILLIVPVRAEVR